MGDKHLADLSHLHCQSSVLFYEQRIQLAKIFADSPVELSHWLNEINLLLLHLGSFLFSYVSTTDEETISSSELAKFRDSIVDNKLVKAVEERNTQIVLDVVDMT